MEPMQPRPVAGSTANFKKNPDNYLYAGPLILSAAVGIEGKINDLAWQHNANDSVQRDWLQCTPKAAAFAEIEVWSHASQGRGAKEIRLVDSASDVGVRYLPYQENKLSYMKLDAEAKWVFTGPIEGCFVYVVRHNQDTYLFHVNANIVGDGAANAQAKDQKLRAAVTTLLNGGDIVHRLSRDDYLAGAGETRGSRGFVYGRRLLSGWEFRCHSIILDNNSAETLHPATPLPNGKGMRA